MMLSPEEHAARVQATSPTYEQWQRFVAIRAALFAALASALDGDDHCKSYEGALELYLPNYFEERAARTQQYGRLEQGAWCIVLHCYLIGPNRHYRWEGASFEEVLQKLELDIQAWIKNDYTIRHDVMGT